MPATLKELESFSRFATQRLQQESGLTSLEECLRQWRAEQERTALIEDVVQGGQDFEEGRTQALDEAFDEVRRLLEARR